jgi:ParB family chromosome partitioning protein
MTATPSATLGQKRPALGRGLSALIPARPSTSFAPGVSSLTTGLLTLGIETLQPSRAQPRKQFQEEPLEELAASIREHGILQPVVVRRNSPTTYEIIAGERRWRAAQRAGLTQIPAVLKDVASSEVLTLALVENLQRQDLNPMEEAEAYRNLIDELNVTQEEVARRIGKDRATIANAMRLLKLPLTIREAVVDGILSMGHARALLSLAEENTSNDEAMIRAAREVMTRNLSVRQTEALVRARKTGEADRADSNPSSSSAVRDLEEHLRRRFGVKCTVKAKDGRGVLELHFGSLDELDEILVKMGVK